MLFCLPSSILSFGLNNVFLKVLLEWKVQRNFCFWNISLVPAMNGRFILTAYNLSSVGHTVTMITFLRKDLTESIKRGARQILQTLFDRNIIDKYLYWKVKPTDSPTPRFHGLPKIHKPEIPI